MCPDDTRPVQVSTTHGVIDASTPLFLLTLKVPTLSDSAHEYSNAWLALLRTSDYPYWYNFERLMLDYTPGMEREYGAIFLMQDCFTWEEMGLIRAYFERYSCPGATLVHERVCLPVSCSTLPAQFLQRPGRWIQCPFDQQPYFDCPVVFEGYFNPQWPNRVPAAVNTGQYRTPGGHA